MDKLDQAVSTCIRAIKQSRDCTDDNCVSAFSNLLDLIVSDPSCITNYHDEERLSVLISSILINGYAKTHRYHSNVKTTNLLFAVGFYLFMKQLCAGSFYDRDWPAFIVLIHNCRDCFADFIDAYSPDSLASVYNVFDVMTFHDTKCQTIDIVKGIELNFMAVCKGKGFFTNELEPWFDELYQDCDKLLKDDYFHKNAIPLYNSFADNFSKGNLKFLDMD